jgi:phosphate transport system substrate-binding protein
MAAMSRVGAVAAQQDPDLHLRVLPSLGSTGAVRAVADGAIDVAVIGRPLRDSEKGTGLAEREVARTPFVFAVGSRSGTTGITTDQLVAIYLGTRLAWPDGQRVRPVLRPPSDADTEILRAISPEVADALDAAGKRRGMLVGTTNTECNDLIDRVPGAVGPTTLLQIRAEKHQLRALTWNGVAPSLENLESGRYPLVKSIHVVYRSPGRGAVRSLVGFLGSPSGRALLRELGALPVAEGPVP